MKFAKLLNATTLTAKEKATADIVQTIISKYKEHKEAIIADAKKGKNIYTFYCRIPQESFYHTEVRDAIEKYFYDTEGYETCLLDYTFYAFSGTGVSIRLTW